MPTYRVDVEREIDLIEEIARAYGYNRIEAKSTATVDLQGRLFHSIAGRKSPLGADRERIPGSHHLFHARPEESVAGSGKACHPPQPPEHGNGGAPEFTRPRIARFGCPELSYGNPDLRLFEIGHVFAWIMAEQVKLVENFLEEERVAS